MEGLNGSDDLQKYLTFRRTNDILQNMEKDKTITHDELRPEYDLRNLRVRKFGPARKQFGNFIKLEPDIAAVFPDAASVNEALRFLISVTKENSTIPPTKS